MKNNLFTRTALFFVLVTCCLALHTSAQQQPRRYTNEWKRIDSLLEKAALPQSALKEVNAIYASAKKENNEVQLIRALVYRMSINDQLSEQGKYENIQLLEQEIKSAKEPARSILSSMAGGSYWHYLQLNRWQFYNRTRVSSNMEEDINTWDITRLHERIAHHFHQSLANDQLLKRTPLEKYDPIIIKGNARKLRPTLYDLLAHRAVNYFRNDERYVTKPAFYFTINDSIAFADAAAFSRHTFTTSDTTANQYHAIRLYQSLIAFHLGDKDKAALLDADIDRLEFVRNFGTHPNRDILYKNALERLVNSAPNAPNIADALFLLAQWHYSRGLNYPGSGDSASRLSLVEAKNWCERALNTRDSSEGKSNARILLQEITSASIAITAEKVNTPGSPFRVLVSHKNAAQAHFRIILADDASRQSFLRNQWQDSAWRRMINTRAVRNLHQTLPQAGDMQLHHFEMKVDALPVGEYAMLVSNTPQFSLDTGSMSLVFFYVSNLAYVHSGVKYYVVNRTSGKTVPAANVKVWSQEYDYRKERQVLKKIGEHVTDKNGFFALKAPANNERREGYRIEISTNNDRLFTDDISGFPYYHEINRRTEQTFLFTDRAIYRPGQIVYFKGIRTRSEKEGRSNVMGNASSWVKLVNANGESSDSLRLTTNTFGSYTGRFTLPSGILNGEFFVRDESTGASTMIRVEEYKRPRFYVEIGQPRGTYRVGDTVRVDAVATSYTGASVTGASVNYRVVRRAEIPMWMPAAISWKIWPPYPTRQMEIAHGTGTTDANGKFSISFKAIPDEQIPESRQPVFHYEVLTDITDISGETQSGTNTIPVAYQALKIRTELPSNMHADSLHSLLVRTTNMADSFESANIRVTISKLLTPERKFRQRLWQQPDQFVMSEDEYRRLFPHDVYANEADVDKWKQEREVINITATTNRRGPISLPAHKLDTGWYVVDISSTDRYGRAVTDKKFVQLTRNNAPGPFYLATIKTAGENPEPGKDLRFELLTNIDDAWVISETVAGADTINETWKAGSVRTIRVDQSHRGSITIKTVVIQDNRIYSDLHTVAIADTGIVIDYITFRDKTQPGNHEKWKVTIKGKRGEKLAAELLTAMYDASLDQFTKHEWLAAEPSYFPVDVNAWSADNNFSSIESFRKYAPREPSSSYVKTYDRLLTTDEGGVGYDRPERYAMNGRGAVTMNAEGAITGKIYDMKAKESAVPTAVESRQAEEVADQSAAGAPTVQPRKNLQELAFFFPQLQTNENGEIEFSFTAPEALTTWKWLLFAHTRSFHTASTSRQIITQKDLMVQPNVPRFLRAGDRIEFTTKIINNTDSSVSGQTQLALLDPASGKVIDAVFTNNNNVKTFTAGPRQSVPVAFILNVPGNYNNLLTWRIIASASSHAGSFSDGEEAILPVLTNKIPVTETLPIVIRGNQQKNFRFEKLLNSGSSKSLVHHALTVEFTTNPAWYAVQALPYLVQGEKENAEQVFNRFYANAIGSSLAANIPRLKQIVSSWKNADTSAFLSNLQKNEDLKSLVLQETPWVLEAKTEAQQKKNIALLFDMARMADELQSSLLRLQQLQVESGGFAWYPGAPEDRYMTQYIVTGIGRLRKLNAVPVSVQKSLDQVAQKALRYLDRQVKRDYDQVRRDKNKSRPVGVDNLQIHYLYMRSYFPSRVAGDVFPAFNFFRNELRKQWQKQSSFMKGMAAVALHRTGDLKTAANIVASLKESAIVNEETGTYWKDMSGGYYWYQAPVESQALMIETFAELTDDSAFVNNLKMWLLKNKQTSHWRSSRATADACYALLARGTQWLDDVAQVDIQLGNKKISAVQSQEGTGYFRVTLPADSVQAAQGNVSVDVKRNTSSAPAWGAVYWQYVEEAGKITGAASPLRIRKQVMVQRNTDRGPVLDTLGTGNSLRVGDKIRVRVEIRSDRRLEYVHMKDLRAAAFEPVNVLSSYKWQDGLGYYESTTDAAVNFYFQILPKGVHIFEYELFATQAGTFSNGITTIQCMYAPEFASHSEGIIVNVRKP